MRNERRKGMEICSALLVAFIILKIIGMITWSWWWVLSPLWIPFAAVVIFLLVVAVIGGIVSLFE